MDILKFLKRKDMTQQELGNAIGTTNQNVNRWVTGKGVPSYEMCRELLKLGITVEELFGIEYNHMPEFAKEIINRDPRDEEKRFREGVEKALRDILGGASKPLQ